MATEHRSKHNSSHVNKDGEPVTDWRKEIPAIDEIVNVLVNEGAYDDMVSFRGRESVLKKHYNNPLDSEISINSRTTKTNLFKSFLGRVTVELFRRKMSIPSFDIESFNDSEDAYEEKTMASVTKALITWMIRMTKYENVVKASRENQLAFGDRYIRPFLRKTSGGKGVAPAVQDISGRSIMIDPNSSSLHDESYAEQAQYVATTIILPERNIISKYGKDILSVVSPGFIVDNDGYTKDLKGRSSGNRYEELIIQDRASGNEFCLIGSGSFPVILNMEEGLPNIPEEIKGLIEDENSSVSWVGKYKYKDDKGENMLLITNNRMYFDQDSPRNWGIMDRMSVLQVLHEIGENLKIDNMIQKLDNIKFLIGGNDRTTKSFKKYRVERLTNRHAVWNIPGSLGKNPPVPGVLKNEGIPAQEGQLLTDDIMNLGKYTSGTDPKQLEVQKNTAVTQTQIVEEKSTESILDVADQNIPGFESDLRALLAFGIAHKGFGMNDVKISFTKYSKDMPDGDSNATITIPNAFKKIKEYGYQVIVDQSSIVKRSRFGEVDQLSKALQFMDPSATPEWYRVIVEQILKNLGVPVPAVSDEQVAEISARGGSSQFAEEPEQDPVTQTKPQPDRMPGPGEI